MLMINLLPWRENRETKIKQRLHIFYGLIVVIMLFCMMIFYNKYKNKRQHLTNLTTEIFLKEQQLFEQPALDKFSILNKLEESTFTFFIEKINKIAFINITLESIHYVNESVILIGEVYSLKTLSNFLTNLNDLFNKASLDEIYQSSENFKKFRINISLN